MKKTGVIILIVGALITVLTALNFSYTTRENIIDAGKFQINQNTKRSLPWSPIIGIVIMVSGGAVYLLGLRKTLLR